MSELLLTGTWEHALLAAVVQEARRAADQKGGFVGRTALQKLMYFLKRSGVPMSYRFDIYHYGPFCHEILRDAEWLQADKVIVDRTPEAEKYSNYAPGAALDELISAHEEEINRHRKVIRTVVGALVPMRPERLELIATLDYLYRSYAATGKSGPWKDTVVARFLEIKGSRFSSQDVMAAYGSLRAAGLIGE